MGDMSEKLCMRDGSMGKGGLGGRAIFSLLHPLPSRHVYSRKTIISLFFIAKTKLCSTVLLHFFLSFHFLCGIIHETKKIKEFALFPLLL